MSSLTVIYDSFFNVSICKVRGKTVLSQGYYVASSLALKTKTETRAFSCVMWFDLWSLWFCKAHPKIPFLLPQVIIPRGSKQISDVEVFPTVSPWSALNLSRTCFIERSSPSDSVTVEIQNLSTREHQNYTGSWDVHSDRDRRWILEAHFSTFCSKMFMLEIWA